MGVTPGLWTTFDFSRWTAFWWKWVQNFAYLHFSCSRRRIHTKKILSFSIFSYQRPCPKDLKIVCILCAQRALLSAHESNCITQMTDYGQIYHIFVTNIVINQEILISYQIFQQTKMSARLIQNFYFLGSLIKYHSWVW